MLFMTCGEQGGMITSVSGTRVPSSITVLGSVSGSSDMHVKDQQGPLSDERAQPRPLESRPSVEARRKVGREMAEPRWKARIPVYIYLVVS